MNCEQIEALDLAARYVAGQLDPSEREAYEQHYFECAQCFEDVQLRLAMRDELSAQSRSGSLKVSGRRSSSSWMIACGAIAAGVVLAVAIGWNRVAPKHPPAAPIVAEAPAPVPQPDPLVLLARVDPPPYQRPSLRGARAGEERFRQAMDQYLQHDYTSAINGLRAATAADPKSADAQFFLGVCYLLQGDPTAAIARLNATIKLGETLDLEPAHFYLAKAFLQSRDLPAATRELESTAALHGDLEQPARQLLDQLRKLPGAR